MNGLLYLTSEDFSPTTQNGKKMMIHSISGFSLILFYSNHCKFCPEYTSLFKLLPGSVSGCQFGILNVDSNKEFINASKNTISQINYVPFILLYVNGVPFMKYNGPGTIQELSRFIVEVSKNIQQRQKYKQTQRNTKQIQKQLQNKYRLYVWCILHVCYPLLYVCCTLFVFVCV